DESATRAAESLVRRSAYEISVGHGARVNARGDESGDVGHVHEKDGSIVARGFRDAWEIDDARIGAGSRNDHFRFMLGGEAGDRVVVNLFRVPPDAVGDELVHAAGEIERMAVRQMAAMGKIHSEDGVAGLERGHVNGNVGLRAGVRLYVGVLSAENGLGAING